MTYKIQNMLRANPFRVAKFIVVGAIGFAIEAVIITVSVKTNFATAVSARVLSFPAAVVVTWLLNRMLTFGSRSPMTIEFARYLSTQIVGALTNLAVYWGLISTNSVLEYNPVIALAIAAIVGLVVNYTLSALWVFGVRSRNH